MLMKKLLLSFVALLMGVGVATAEERTVTITGDDALWEASAGQQKGTKDGVTIETSNGMLGSGTQYRAYKNQTFTVSVSEGNITKIQFTCTASGDAQYGPGNFTDATSGTYAYADKVGTWLGSAPSVEMTASTNQVRMTEIVVTYEVGETTGPEVVGLALTEASAVQTEYYEGDAFNHEGIVVTATFDDESTKDVTNDVAWSYTPGSIALETKSVEVTAIYKNVSASKTYEVIVKTIANTPETAYTIEEAVKLIDAGKGLSTKVYVKGKISKVEEYIEKYSSITYWISADGSEEGQQFQCYSGKNIGGEDFASVEDLKVGASVVVYGELKKHGDVYEFNYNNEIVSVTTTGIGEVSGISASANGKFVENGRIVIVKDGKKFNVAGQVQNK